MSQATTAQYTTTSGIFDPNTLPEKSTNTSNWKMFMWLFLAQDAMTFFTLFAGYLGLRIGAEPGYWPVPSEKLGINLTALMTFILIVSSVTMVQAVAAIQKGDRKRMKMFLGLTILGGLFFLGCQVYEYSHLIGGEGMSISKHLFDATFFVLTSFHGLHVLCGVIYLTSVFFKANNYSKDNYTHVEVVGLYWHFVDLVWIILFTLVYLI